MKRFVALITTFILLLIPVNNLSVVAREAPADTPYLLGDVDYKDDVTAADALMALQEATDKVVLTDKQIMAANVDGQADITGNDALLILQYATKKLDCFSPFLDRWNGTTDTNFFLGRGSSSRPYLISSAEQLAYLASRVNAGNLYNGVHFALDRDLDLQNIEWTPIGNGTYSFQGILDGNGHTIRNMKITKAISYTNDSGQTWGLMGLFGYIKNASIKNLNVDKVNIVLPLTKSYDYTHVGVLAGRVYALNNVVYINNCKVTSSQIDVTQFDTCLYAGGLFGYVEVAKNGVVKASKLQSEGTVSSYSNSGYSFLAGIAGYVSNKGKVDVENFACYENINWPNKAGTNCSGAFGAVNNHNVGDTILSNAFSSTTVNNFYNSFGNDYSYVGNVIIGKTYNAKSSTKEDPSVFRCRNLYGNMKAKTSDLFDGVGVTLYNILSESLNENNCTGGNSLPANHGLDSSVWDLTDTSHPILR